IAATQPSANGAARASRSTQPTPSTTNGAIAALDTSTSTPTASNGTKSSKTGQMAAVGSASTTPTASTIPLTGMSPTLPVRVVYNQGSQPTGKSPVTPLVDVALDLVGSRVWARQPVVTDRAIGHLAGALLGKGKGDKP